MSDDKYQPKSYEQFKDETLADPKVLAAYQELEEEFALVAELIKARKMAGKSQKEIAANMHTSQSTVARLESGYGHKRHSPTLETLKKYAKAVGCKLSIKLIPRGQSV